MKAQRRLILPLFMVAGLTISGTLFAKENDPTEFVNPFIGTSGHGHTYPGATLPFSMVQVSPDTYTSGWDWCSGYHWSDNSLIGFSHTHLSGTGCGDLGDILIMPTTGTVKLDPGTREQPEKGYRSRFSHEDEKASPGYYSVLLKTYGIQAELTATKRVGVHRYTFPAVSEGNVVIDLVHGIGDNPIATELNIVGDRTVTGFRRSHGWATDHSVFFVAEFSKPFKAFGATLDTARLQPGARHAEGKTAKGWVTFETADKEPVLVKVAISTTSVEGAMRNLKAEMPEWNFNSVRKAARKAWQQELSKVQVEGIAKNDSETFYTALYHSLVAPTLISDVDGQYRGSDRQVHQANGFDNYSTFSLWDTFRAEQPLFTILSPARVTDMIKAFQAQAEYHKDKTLPIWPLYANETYCMIGYHSFSVIAEAYAKGIRGWDTNAMFQLMVDNTKRNDWWADRGYIPADKENESVSKTLEFAYDDWALAQFAKALGKTAEYDKYMKRATVYKNVFNPETGFMRGRLQDGSWRTPFNPEDVTSATQHDFTEGNSWQYTWFVPHDMQGLMNLMGGRKAFLDKLDTLFSHVTPPKEGQVPDVSGLVGQYAHGNEPSHHIAYFYACAGMPWKTQDRIRQICSELYNNTPEGLCGNEDCGQMSAWYVFSTLGFYPMNPVQATYVLGLPSFPKASIKLANGKKFTVVAKKLSAKNRYVENVRLNGRDLPRVYLTHAELLAGGTLEFIMAEKPGSVWGTQPDAAPPSMSK